MTTVIYCILAVIVAANVVACVWLVVYNQKIGSRNSGQVHTRIEGSKGTRR